MNGTYDRYTPGYSPHKESHTSMGLNLELLSGKRVDKMIDNNLGTLKKKLSKLT